MKERLQKILSSAHISSRRAAEAMILAGRVTVNGNTAVLGQSADPETDEIFIDGVPLERKQERTYILLNKPRGYVTTLSDEKGRPTVADLVRDAGTRVYPVGRLDYDSDGLLLMTDDGALANAMMHPSGNIGKTYLVQVSGDITRALPVLRGMLTLDGCSLRPAIIEPKGEKKLEITIFEGKNRQVRRMCAAAGLHVQRLTRISEGPLSLGELPPGKWRRLRREEAEALLKEVLPGAERY